MDRPKPLIGVAQMYQAEFSPESGQQAGFHLVVTILLTVPKEMETAGVQAGVKESLISTFLQG